MKTRDPYWDAIKFVLICLVVYVHTIDRYSPDGSFNRAMFNFNVMFHMPLFIFISGRFSHIHNRDRYKRSFIKLFETYIVFQIIHNVISYAGSGTISLNILLYPAWTLWYFLALIYWRLIILCIPKRWLQYQKSILTTSFIISLSAGFLPIDYLLAIQKTLAYLPFFFIGYYSEGIDVRHWVQKIPLWTALTVLFATFCLFYFLLNRDLSSIQLCYSSYWSSNILHTLINLGGRTIFIISAIIVSIMVMRCIPEEKHLATWGMITMFIYVYHSIVLIFLHAAIARNYVPNNEVLLVIYAAIIVIGLLCLSRSKYLNLLINPSSLINKEA